MVRPFGKLVLTLGALALVASPAWAQAEKKGRGFGGFGAGMILRAENVQKDLKLSDEQTGKIQDTLRSVNEKHRDDLAGLRDLSREEAAAKRSSILKEASNDIKKDLSFTPEQSKRYDQISLQALGVMAFGDPAVQEKLKLTADQKSQIREIGAAGGGRGAFNKDASKEERAEAAKKAFAAREENLKKVMALLTDDQKNEWKELTGEPIELRFGGGGGRRNNNN